MTTRARGRVSSEPDLADVRRALADRHPLSLFSLVSTLLCFTDSRRHHLFARPDAPDPAALTREELVRTFLDVPTPETSALRAVIAEMAGDDDLLRTRVRRELAARPKVEPAWLAQLSETATYRAVRIGHPLGDGDNILLGARLPGGSELTCLVYIDHNLGTLVKDAFVVPESIASMVAKFRRVTEDPDTRFDDISLADARAWVDAAVELATITFPPLETESWPACRALVEWVTRGLPEGGSGYQRPQWDSMTVARITEQFFASSYGARLDDPDNCGLLESLLCYGTDYGPGDPLRWSPVKIEILLGDWIPRKIVAPAEYLAKAPHLLRAFIRFAHAQVGLRTELTDEALAAIDDSELRYQQTIRSPRPQGPAALLGALGVDTEDMADMPFGPEEPENFEHSMLARLALDVGDPIQLDQLDDNPLPDEPFRWEVHLRRRDGTCPRGPRAHRPLLRRNARHRVPHCMSTGTCPRRINGTGSLPSQRSCGNRGCGAGLDSRQGQRPARAAARRHTRKGSHESFRSATEQYRLAWCNHLARGRISRRHLHLRLGSPDYLVAARRRRIIKMRNDYRQLGEEMS